MTAGKQSTSGSASDLNVPGDRRSQERRDQARASKFLTVLWC
jgi:hypothetical protein